MRPEVSEFSIFSGKVLRCICCTYSWGHIVGSGTLLLGRISNPATHRWIFMLSGESRYSKWLPIRFCHQISFCPQFINNNNNISPLVLEAFEISSSLMKNLWICVIKTARLPWFRFLRTWVSCNCDTNTLDYLSPQWVQQVQEISGGSVRPS